VEMIRVSFDEAPASLGGVSDVCIDFVASSSSFYCSLERMKYLPPLLVPKNVYKHDGLRQIYNRLISRGDLVARRYEEMDSRKTALLASFDSESEPFCLISFHRDESGNITHHGVSSVILFAP
jgi:hypothetical protein